MTREEHLQWCKDRALEYLDAGDVPNAFASFAGDWTKHAENADRRLPLVELGILYVTQQDQEGMRRWITGFR